MTITNRIRRWWHLRKMASLDRECQRRGHADTACWAVTGATGVECRRCKRIIWFGRHRAADYYQAPTRLAEGNWR
jgi:hypothetical protein